ncbi:hypothetical protein L249_0777 [Ophiocordyceps polyrhachis-furcata BCC 54312]|uniref:RBR-type E3 ubiquitin transferase n=1 Tax=Ophiocordyceps polyrhachis-furcata BCC 54312 TaxID=1330021 RepID=A0A367LCM0_9HYPO|nr:hypothetical protein L249_0777 [Ophiocordyceps polyrhachis-furcata BCC 54312]
MDVSGLDDDSIRLMIGFLQEDIQALKDSDKEKYAQGNVPDWKLALDAFESELASLESHLADRSMTTSIARAVATDGNLAQMEQPAETQTEQLAETQTTASDIYSCSGHATPAQVEEATGSGPLMNGAEDELIRKLQALYNGYPEEEDEPDEAGPSSGAVNRPKQTNLQSTVICSCCGDARVFYDVARCPCDHEYCRDCLGQLFEASIGDESLFPPRCCKRPIPIEENQIFLPYDLVRRLKTKKIEFETPNRTYCYDPACSAFIPIQSIKIDVGSCANCARTTCTICKQQSHTGDCPQDPAVEEFRRIAAENKWQRCSSCQRFIELDFGCNHITCICGAEFCYVCGVLWKTCGCDTWDEDQLLNRAAVVVDRDILDGVFIVEDEAARAQHVREAADYLVQNHECQHERWRGIGGRFRCEECSHWLDQFIYQCRQCRIRACRRCRFNRL